MVKVERNVANADLSIIIKDISKMSVPGGVVKDGYRIDPESQRQMDDMVDVISGRGFKNGGRDIGRNFAVIPDAWRPEEAAKEICMIALTPS